LDEKQAVVRSQGENNHGLGWGKTAVEMALLRQAALAGGKERVSSRSNSSSSNSSVVGDVIVGVVVVVEEV